LDNNDNKALSRLLALFDEESFVESDALVGGNVAAGYGLIDGAVVCAFAENSGGMDFLSAEKIVKLYKNAVKNGCPVIGIYDSKGGDIKDGRRVLSAYAKIAAMSANLSGAVPQIAVVTGVCAGAAATLAGMADFLIMCEKAELFITPPFIAEDAPSGAGSAANAVKSGTASILAKDADDAVKKARDLMKILPQNNLELSGNDNFEENDDPIAAGLKAADVARNISDKNSVVEINAGFGKSAYTALGSVSWRTVGFVAADGRIGADDAAKIARFVSFCDAFSIPVVNIIDSEGFELSSASELGGFIKGAAKLTQTYAVATTPKISIVTGNAVGGVYIALAASSDFVFAYGNAVIFPIPEKASSVFLGAEYDASAIGAVAAAKEGFVDRIIEPEDVKEALLHALDLLSGKRVASPSRKHTV